MKKKRGFTLFELLVSISIIAILTALATVSYSLAQRKARDARRTQDMDSVRKAEELFYSQNNYLYAASAAELTTGGFLEKLPTDPKNSGDYVYDFSTWDTLSYCFCIKLENSDLAGGKPTGNATDDLCTMGNGDYYCVKQQQ